MQAPPRKAGAKEGGEGFARCAVERVRLHRDAAITRFLSLPHHRVASRLHLHLSSARHPHFSTVGRRGAGREIAAGFHFHTISRAKVQSRRRSRFVRLQRARGSPGASDYLDYRPHVHPEKGLGCSLPRLTVAAISIKTSGRIAIAELRSLLAECRLPGRIIVSCDQYSRPFRFAFRAIDFFHLAYYRKLCSSFILVRYYWISVSVTK